MKVLISGYFGFGNLGDEAILEATIDGLRRDTPGIEIVVLSADPLKTSKDFNVETISRYNLLEIVDGIKTSDVVLSGGGGLLQDKTSLRSLLYYLFLIYLAKFYRKKVIIFGSGLGPINSRIGKFLTSKILNKVDLMLLRDENSLLLGRSLGIKRPPTYVTGDLAGLLKGAETQDILKKEGIVKGEGPIIGVSVREPLSNYKALAETLDYLIEKKSASVVFIPFQGGDFETIRCVMEEMKYPANFVSLNYTPREVIYLISNFDLIIGMRLHSLILSVIAGAPIFGISYDHKVETFLQNLGEPYIPVDALKGEVLVEEVEKILVASSEIKEKLEIEKRKLYAKAMLNFGIFFNFLRSIETIEILGVKVDNLTMDEAVQKIDELIKKKSTHMVLTLNPEIIVASHKDPELKDAINCASLRLPDGVGLLIASRILGKSLRERVAGIDLIRRLIKLSQDFGYGIYLLGGAPSVAEAAAEALKEQFKNLNIVGTHHGFFKDDEEKEIIEDIKKANPSILLVGMGAGKQEKWLSKNLKELGIPVSITVGGSFDVISGKIKRAPVIFQKAYLEWLYRLIREPWRWRRMLALPKFLLMILYGKISNDIRFTR